jgi:Tol biopolymer transport system component
MKNKILFSVLFGGLLTASLTLNSAQKEVQNTSFSSEKNSLLSNSRQLTFEGPRSGEGYFSADGTKMIFQSERVEGNPFYQMFVLDLKTGKSTLVSTGVGKTTCGWIHPDMKKVMWSSTHADKHSADKVKAEYEERKKPVKGRYSWSFDDQFDIYESDLHGKNLKRLTNAPGYDAEGSYSPDGKWIAFASNRSMYPKSANNPFADLYTEEQKKFLEKDASFAMEIYIMKADGTQVKRLTNSPGYDGGPFFSADGKKITWRRFSADGTKAEIYTMNADGTDQKQITTLGSMSWAPYFHPSGKYIIFGSSVLGFSNFELFIVDAEGKQKPVQVTFADGFDGLASFSPDGNTLTWSHRNEKGESQIYLADWDHAQALKLLNLKADDENEKALTHLTSASISEKDVRATVQYLASEKMQGRMTGTPEEESYTKEIADLFGKIGLKPAVGNNFIQEFEFTSGVTATEKNQAELKGRVELQLKRGQDYQVLSYSKNGSFPAAPVVFAGYGVMAPATEKMALFDSYKDLDVKGKWVVLLDGIPEELTKETKLHLLSYSRPQHKITVAKTKGAAGVIFVSDLPLKPEVKFEGSLSETTLPVLKISTSVMDQLLKATEYKKYATLKSEFEMMKTTSGFTFGSQYMSAQVDLILQKSKGHNVVGLLPPVSAKKNSKAVLIGAHGDHLGRGDLTGSSLARADEKGKVHFGADDNASGVAGVIELAAYFAEPKMHSQLKKPLYFAVWSGEEIGVLGSSYFVKNWKENKKTEFKNAFEAGLNMDMIGRLRDRLQIQGVGSAKQWSPLAEEVGLVTGVPLTLTTDPYLPTDAMSVYLGEVPSISFFTGSHEEYHSPRDTADTLNYPGLVRVIGVVGKYTEKLATVSMPILTYEKVEGNNGQKLEGRQFRIYLGTIPDYSQEGVKGVRISGASKNSPAEKAGIKSGDVIVEFDNAKIENLYDYVYALQAVKPNKTTKLSIMRDGKIVDLEITPVLKE